MPGIQPQSVISLLVLASVSAAGDWASGWYRADSSAEALAQQGFALELWDLDRVPPPPSGPLDSLRFGVEPESL